MTSIEKKQLIIDDCNRSAQKYLYALVQEAYRAGELSRDEVQNIQAQCIALTALRCEKYTSGESSSVRVEVAESIMDSNLYTIGIYLETCATTNQAVKMLKTERIRNIYEKGLKTIDTKLQATKHVYWLAKKNKLKTPNDTYNATLSPNGIDPFFDLYNPEYEAQEIPGSIDYQLCNPVEDFMGIEFIQKYIAHLYFENKFCEYFDQRSIHHLLCGYDDNYKDLLINIFEYVLIEALGCIVVSKDPLELTITPNEIDLLQRQFNNLNEIEPKIDEACHQLFKCLDIESKAFKDYIKQALPKIIMFIQNAVELKTLDKVFITAKNPDFESKIAFTIDRKMENIEYRQMIEELIECRYFSDKAALIKDRLHALGDFEDMLFDANLTDEEIEKAFQLLDPIEIGVFVKKYNVCSTMSAVQLSGNELRMQEILKKYIDRLDDDKKEEIFALISQIMNV